MDALAAAFCVLSMALAIGASVGLLLVQMGATKLARENARQDASAGLTLDS